jgi:type I restriction enzyme S subunit
MSNLSYIEKLLDGVEVAWVALGLVAKKIYSGGTPDTKNSEYWVNGTIPWMSSGEVNLKIIEGTEKFISEAGFNNSSAKWIPKDSIVMALAGQGKTRGKVARTRIDLTTNQSLAALTFDERQIDAGYIFHFLEIQYENLRQISSGDSGRGGLNLKMIASYKVPIPCPDNPKKSLEIQAEIVRILDTFTELTAALTAELNARKKQYNHYRDQLLSFEEGEVEWKTLLDACDYVDYRGKTPTKTQEGIFLVTAKNIRMGYIDYETSQEFISEDDYDEVMRRGLPKKGDVLITTEAPCGFVAQVNRENIALAQRVIKYRSKNKRLSNSFLKHYLLGSQFQDKLIRAATGSTVKGIKGSKLHKLTIPIPSEAEQARIVTILDKFDALTNSISEGLPREIALRQKQYEYYRDLLFSFPKPAEVTFPASAAVSEGRDACKQATNLATTALKSPPRQTVAAIKSTCI